MTLVASLQPLLHVLTTVTSKALQRSGSVFIDMDQTICNSILEEAWVREYSGQTGAHFSKAQAPLGPSNPE
jgi:hypothetical protein